MSAQTENTILDYVYALLEGDDDGWSTSSDEYLAGRKYLNMAVNRWEFYENVRWKELWGTLADAADGTKTLTAATYSYSCPTDFRFPGSWVRTVDSNSNSTYFRVITPAKVAQEDDKGGKWCYFLGNPADGYTLNFNPELTLTTSDTIKYEYYKNASTYTTTSSTSEVPDYFYLVYSVLSRFYTLDGEDTEASKAFQEAEARLEQMRVNNMLGLEGMPDPIEDVNFDIFDQDGFGQ